MVKSLSNSGSLGLNKINTCLLKTELYEMEVRYPPFDWMKILGDEQDYHAHDPKAFLACIRR